MISVIIPVYNEENGIVGVVEGLKSILSNSYENYEIIIVDDGSTDRTFDVISKIDEIKVFKHKNNIGYGRSIKTGMRKAIYNNIVITDGDSTYPNDMIPELVKSLDENDMVVGARPITSENIASIRRPMKWFIGKLAAYLTNTEIPDLNSGLRAFKKDIAMKFWNMYPKGFSFTTTITLAMHSNGFDVKYIPITYGKRTGKSKISPFTDTLNFFQLIYRTIMYFNPMKVFLPLSIMLLIISLSFLFYDIYYLENLTDKTIIAFESSIQVFIIGLIADLISKRISITK